MNTKLRYDSPMNHLLPVLIAILALMLTPVLAAQGVPASVTSPRFGGNDDHNRSNGIPASVTSPGFGGNGQNGNSEQQVRFFSEPANPHTRDHNRDGNHDRSHFRHEQQIQYYPYAVPYYPVLDPSEPSPADQPANDHSKDDAEYKGGPTIFDRRGEGLDRYDEQRAAKQKPKSQPETTDDSAQPSTPEPVAEQPTTLLIFKDGHQLEIGNYAILGSTLFDLTPGHPRKIALAELDLSATIAQNDDRGVDFHLPTGKKAN